MRPSFSNFSLLSQQMAHSITRWRSDFPSSRPTTSSQKVPWRQNFRSPKLKEPQQPFSHHSLKAAPLISHLVHFLCHLNVLLTFFCHACLYACCYIALTGKLSHNGLVLAYSVMENNGCVHLVNKIPAPEVNGMHTKHRHSYRLFFLKRHDRAWSYLSQAVNQSDESFWRWIFKISDS